MMIESNCVIAVATASDYLNNLARVFQPMRVKTKRTLYVWFFPHFKQVIAMNSDQFIALFVPAVLGRINYSNFGIVFR